MFIARGPAGDFDDLYAIGISPVVVGDEWFFYYMGCSFPHDEGYEKETKREGSIGLARLRLDGFVSLFSLRDSGAALITRPLRFTGDEMFVNCRTNKGWLCLELQDLTGKPIAGFAEPDCDKITTDSVRQLVTWKGRSDVAARSRRLVKVKFIFGDGELFSFGFAKG